MKKVHDDPLNRAIWQALCVKAGEEGYATVYEYVGMIINRTPKTVEYKVTNNDWSLADIRNIGRETGQMDEFRKYI